jgi:L-ascorbate 6-phosphate lactonase
MNLMKRIREFRLEKTSVAMWWLGQNGFIFKSSEGTTASVDLYLTDSCASLRSDMNLKRAVRVLIPPQEVDVDIFACTHNHQDHTDPDTIRGLRNKETTAFLGPMPSCDVFRSESVEDSRIVPPWPTSEYESRDFKLTGTFALPTDDSV